MIKITKAEKYGNRNISNNFYLYDLLSVQKLAVITVNMKSIIIILYAKNILVRINYLFCK